MDKSERGKRAKLNIYDDAAQYDIVKYVKEVLGLELLPFQEEMLKTISEKNWEPLYWRYR